MIIRVLLYMVRYDSNTVARQFFRAVFAVYDTYIFMHTDYRGLALCDDPHARPPSLQQWIVKDTAVYRYTIARQSYRMIRRGIHRTCIHISYGLGWVGPGWPLHTRTHVFLQVAAILGSTPRATTTITGKRERSFVQRKRHRQPEQLQAAGLPAPNIY